MKKIFFKDFIFFLLITYISSIIIIPFQTNNPLLTNNEALKQLIKNTPDKNLVNTLSRNLIYTNLNIGQNIQTISTFFEMANKNFAIRDEVVKGHYKIGNQRNINFTYNDNNLLNMNFRNIYYNSNISGSFRYVNECYYDIRDFCSIRNLCGNENIFLRQKNNIKDNDNIKPIDFYIRFQQLEEFDHRPSIIGLNYYNNFIYELKQKREINSYDFSFKYSNEKEDSGELIIGDLPHIYDTDNYKEDNLRSAKIIKAPTIDWGAIFDVYISDKNKNKNEFVLTVEEKGYFYIEEFFITGSHKYFTYIEENFFKKYLEKNICTKTSHNKAYYLESFFYFVLLCCRSETGEHLHIHGKTLYARTGGLVMLQRQNGSGYQHGNLFAVYHRFKGSAKCHFGLAEADISAQKSVHRMRGTHIFFNFHHTAFLVDSFIIHKQQLKITLQIIVFRAGKALYGLPFGIQFHKFFCHFFQIFFGSRLCLAPLGRT